MSILIKNMDMPDKCWDCELFDELAIHFTGITAPNTDIGWCRGCKKEILDTDYKEDKPLWCPLVEISTPHGDLIDIDTIDFTNNDDTSMAFNIGASWAIMQIARAKTIIESEE